MNINVKKCTEAIWRIFRIDSKYGDWVLWVVF